MQKVEPSRIPYFQSAQGYFSRAAPILASAVPVLQPRSRRRSPELSLRGSAPGGPLPEYVAYQIEPFLSQL
jgi:hypothetical protein